MKITCIMLPLSSGSISVFGTMPTNIFSNEKSAGADSTGLPICGMLPLKNIMPTASANTAAIIVVAA